MLIALHFMMYFLCFTIDYIITAIHMFHPRQERTCKLFIPSLVCRSRNSHETLSAVNNTCCKVYVSSMLLRWTIVFVCLWIFSLETVYGYCFKDPIKFERTGILSLCHINFQFNKLYIFFNFLNVSGSLFFCFGF